MATVTFSMQVNRDDIILLAISGLLLSDIAIETQLAVGENVCVVVALPITTPMHSKTSGIIDVAVKFPRYIEPSTLIGASVSVVAA